MKVRDFIIGISMGFVGGGVYGLLTTKRSGKENRRLVKEYREDVSNKFDVVEKDFNRLKRSYDHLQNEALPQAKAFGQETEAIMNDFDTELQMRQRRIEQGVGVLQDDLEQFQKQQENTKQS